MMPVFIHINKTAGTSIAAAASGRIVSAGHRTAAAWVAEHGRSAPMFSVIRHPYDRVRSEYNFRRRRYLGGEDNPHLANLHLPIDDWVEATFERDEFRTRSFFERAGVPFIERNLVGDVAIWFLAQFEWLSAADGSLLVDDVLRFEHLDEDWSAWCAKYRLECPLPHANRSSDVPGAADGLGRRARRVIAEHHAMDFEVFGYRT